MTKLRLTPYNDESAALGVFVEKHNNTTYFEHGAGNEGFSGQYFGGLEDGNGVAVFINSNKPGLLPEVINSVATVYNWKDFYKPVHRKLVDVPESTLQKYAGVYLYEDHWGSILKKDSNWYFFSDGIYAQMYFSSPTHFFNMEFTTEKEFLSDNKGMVTGYERLANNKVLPRATKVIRPDTLHLPKEQMNEIGWHLLESKQPTEALTYLSRAIELYPGDAFLLGNLAHSYLLSNRYKDALDIYKVHLTEKVTENFTWTEMITQDLMTFKQAGYDTAEMNRAFSDLGISKPKGF
jgi:tetratricopeptide (TPR) repeat protein